MHPWHFIIPAGMFTEKYNDHADAPLTWSTGLWIFSTKAGHKWHLNPQRAIFSVIKAAPNDEISG